MLRFGLVCLALCVGTVGVGMLLDQLHLVVSGPCAGPGIVAIYLSILVTFGLGATFTLLGGAAKLIRRLRQSH